MKENVLIISLGLNIWFMIKSIKLTQSLYKDCVIDLPTKRSLILLSIVIPYYGFLTTYFRHKRIANYKSKTN